MSRFLDWLVGTEPQPQSRSNDAAETRSEVFTDADLPITTAPARPTGDGVTITSALSLTHVYRAVSIISTATGQLTLDCWRGTAQIDAPAWVRRPDMKMSQSAFLEQTAVSMALSGNAYWRVFRNSPTDPINALMVLNPFDVAINPDGTYGYGTRAQPFKSWEVEHLALLRVPGSKTGLGPIQAARQDLRGALDLRDYASTFFTESGATSGVLKSDQSLTADQAAQYKAAWDARTYGTAVLGAGLDYRPILLPPADVQFLENQNFSAKNIATLFGIPARLMLVDAGKSEDYANVQDADLQFVKWTLSQYTRAIEQAFSNLLPRTSVARFNLDAFARPNTLQRYQAHAIALTAGFLTKDEIRAIEGLPPLPSPSQSVTETPNE